MIPDNIKIYHITHIHNLAGIAKEGRLWSEASRIRKGLACENVGMPGVKQPRLSRKVDCYPGTTVGHYVPFYFCPRSIMLYILYRGNHPDITYRGGQTPILHLQADAMQVIQWAQGAGIRWAFTDRNARTSIAAFFQDVKYLHRVNWPAVNATDWRDMQIKEGKQAEFLVYESFPWDLVEKIGVIDDSTAQQVISTLAGLDHKPLVQVEKSWYYGS